ncbi:probable protein phosphatase 2C 14 [Spinacia oleracea]|uniref:protein-serine/threonine phosphatase n=1 Tax=Spinacia oleracea TaxID=3562 RepID=A0A9R0IRI4_SPIOL|nr:probable protein phosphatase 2C 14 [Spinacia oleracea]
MPCISVSPQITILSPNSPLSIEMGTSVADLQPCLSVPSSESLNPSFACSLKRKRPPKIQIPKVLQEIAVDTQIKFGCSPVKNDGSCSFEDLGVGVCSIKGKKKFMEDTHKIVSCINGNTKKGFFGVYDGHGGRKAAEFVAESLHKNVIEMLGNSVGNMAKEEAVKAAYLKTDREFLNQEVGSGSCCVTVLIEGTEMVVSNLGDCRAVLCRGGVAEALTKDHRAEMVEERKRIEDKGGYVEFHKGAWRVHGILSVSRSIGDAHLKNWVVSQPDTTILDLTPDMDFLVLASDGLWEEVGNQEAIDIVQQSCVIEKKPEVSLDDLDNKNQRTLKENDDDGYVFVSTSSSPKVKRVSLIKQKKKTTLSLSPRCRITENSSSIQENENQSPPSKKLRKTSIFSHENMKTLSSSPSYRNTERTITVKEGLSDFCNENESPASKLRKTSVFSHENMKILSPSPSYRKTESTSTVKNGFSDFCNENESPPSKMRRTSVFSHKSMNTQSPSRENKRPVSDGLVAACKKLVNLAVSRGSMDDITVMVVDLKHFRLGKP